MTKLPVESWNIKPRLDLPRYDLNEFCPITGEVPEPGSHHIVRKSFTALGKDDNARLYWVELEDGEVIGNRIRLSSQAHFRITTNRAAIVYANGVYYWEEHDTRTPLRWQPPTLHRRKVVDVGEIVKDWHEGIDTTPYRVLGSTFPADPEAQELGGYTEAPSEGEECKLCRRRVPHKKKASSPTSKVFSTRVPVDDAESFDELIESLARHFGVSSKPHHKFWAIHYAAVAALQDEALKDALNG